MAALSELPSIQERTRQALTTPLTPPKLVPKNTGTMPAMPRLGDVSNGAGRTSIMEPRTQQLDAGMAQAATAVQPHVPVRFLVGTAVANHIARARGAGGGGSYSGGGLQGNPNKLLRIAGTQVGVPYVFGDPVEQGWKQNAFDCSGLTAWAFGRLGIQLPHSAAAQSQMFPRVGREQLKPGDLIFYDYGRLGGASDHVAIYVGNGQQIAASSSASQVTVQPVDWSHFIWGGRTPFGGAAVGQGGGGGGGGGGRQRPSRRERQARRGRQV